MIHEQAAIKRSEPSTNVSVYIDSFIIKLVAVGDMQMFSVVVFVINVSVTQRFVVSTIFSLCLYLGVLFPSKIV